MNVLEGGVFESEVSDEVRSVVQLPAAPGDSLVNPEFINDTEICGQSGVEDRTSTSEFVYRLQSYRGKGPRVCVKKGYSAYADSYTRAEESLQQLITQKINADIKYQLLTKSGSKFVAAAGYNFSSLFTGGNTDDISVDFAEVVPTGELSFKALHRIARHLKEGLLATPFSGNGMGQHFRFIGSSDIIESFREETGVKEVLIALTNGGYRLGEETLTGYAWDSAAAYRGIALGIDQRPLRASGFDGDGQPIYVDPIVVVEDDVEANKAHAETNPDWLSAPYEVGFLVAQNTFQRQVPQKYIGEGSFKFSPQLYMGELEWYYQRDNDCNMFGDYGHHIYQITRAYKPIRPQHIVPILYARCEADLGLNACDNSGIDLSGGVL